MISEGGDRDLLVLKSHAETLIVTVAEFLSLVGDN